MADGKPIINAYERMLSRDAQFRTAWDTLAPYIQPTRTGILNQGMNIPGREQTFELYDSTSVTVAETAAAFVWGNVMNPATKWTSLHPRESFGSGAAALREVIRSAKYSVTDTLAENDEVMEWTDQALKLQLAAYEQSNFYYEAFESLIDLIGFGTCDLHIEERSIDASTKPDVADIFRGFVFRNYPIGSFAIDEDSNGEVRTRYCRYDQSAAALVGEFGLDGVSSDIQKAFRDEREKMFEIIHCIKPRDYSEQKSKAAKHMPFASIYVEKNTSHVLRESGYEEWPDAIARYAKTAGEVYGRGLGFTALPDIRSLNKIKYDEFEALEMATKPAIISAVEDGGLGTIQLFPGGFTQIKLRPGMNDVRQAMAPFETGTKWQIVNLETDKIIASIERIFHVKQIRDLLEGDKVQTAYEYAQKLNLLNKMLGPVWGRLQAEFLNRINERSFAIMLRRGAIPRPPDIIYERGATMDWRYDGPLAKAQRADEATSITTWAQEVSVMAQMDPDVVQLGDWKEAARILADVHSVPAKAVRSADEVDAILKGLKEQRQQQDQANQLMQMTEGAKNLAPLAAKVLPEGGLGQMQAAGNA